jgi:hypothetical protein
MLSVTLCAHPTHAQSVTTNIGFGAGSGITRGGSGHNSSTERTPLFIDASVRRYTDEEAIMAIGGSLRIELERNSGVAIAPRFELRHQIGKLELRPGVAIPFFFAPRTMLGPEVSITARYLLMPRIGVVGMLMADAFVAGNDVPHGTTVTMLNILFGVDMEL